ncbi:hypothetical protein DFJ74DRAFT_36873 [Hyaloraphidium curvatum]|nr:hypothetical protein DFJ74DRAFT_36873 [Hyaloraphidium curvatum]
MKFLAPQIWEACATGNAEELSSLLHPDVLQSALDSGGTETAGWTTADLRRRLLFDEPLQGHSAADIAVIYDRPSILRLIVSTESRGDVRAAANGEQWTLLHRAAHRNAAGCALLLVERYPELLRARDARGRTPLSLLLDAFPAEADVEKFQRPFPGGSPPNGVLPRPRFADPPAMRTLVRILLSEGKEANRAQLAERDNEGRTPLLVAVHHRRPHSALLLLRAGADVSARRDGGGRETAGEKILSMKTRSWTTDALLPFWDAPDDPELKTCVRMQRLICRRGGLDFGELPGRDLWETGVLDDGDESYGTAEAGSAPSPTPQDDEDEEDEWESVDEESSFQVSFADPPRPPTPPRPASEPSMADGELLEEHAMIIEQAIAMELTDLDRIAETIRAMSLDPSQPEISIETVLDQMESSRAAEAGPSNAPPPTPPRRTPSHPPSRQPTPPHGPTHDEPDEGEKQCVICLGEAPSVVALPCGHVILCLACMEARAVRTRQACPLCRKTVQSLHRIYL